MKSLDQILKETYGHKCVLKDNGDFSVQGRQDMRRLEQLLIDLERLGLQVDSAKCIRELDKISNETN